ncbi:bacterial low temperature requirement A protein-domain-containing protein [Dichotomocladium elegans]|nr:bacterial low temperature requirement A protein-domain-containing protein [Dichotomocladium elegans]
MKSLARRFSSSKQTDSGDQQQSTTVEEGRQNQSGNATELIVETAVPVAEQRSVLSNVLSRRSTRLSSVSSRTSSRRPRSIVPVHDKYGRPIRVHPGLETVGEMVMHPFQELELLRRRQQEFERERKEWEEKHPGLPMEGEIDIEKRVAVVRTTIHFRHLMNERKIRITDEVVEQLKDPLNLSEEEQINLLRVRHTDDLIDFLHDTERSYAVKVHKTVMVKNQDGDPGDHHKRSRTMSDDARPPILIDLSENIYLEIRFKYDEDDEPITNSRRPIFTVPDPDLSDEIGVHSEATWLELFGDVFYVGFLSTYTHEHHIVDQTQLGIYAAWFVVVWWTWCSGAMYSARYDTADVAHHIYKIIELMGLVGMAGSSHNFWDKPYGFTIGYMVMKAVLLFQYSTVLWPAIVSGSKSKPALMGYVAVHSLALLFWGISLLYLDDRASRFGLWYSSILLECIVHIYFMTKNAQVSLKASHLAERFALFTIIVLGENCMGFIRTVMESGTETRVVIANMFGVGIIFLFFFMYFDDFSKEVLEHTHMSQLWMYLHFPLHLCQVAFGIALSDTISIYSLGGVEALMHNATTQHMSSLALSLAAVAAAEEPSGAGHGEAAAADAGHAEGGGLDPSYVYRSFWVAGGLILVINSLIKLVNTPISAARRSFLICFTRILNAVVFFGLTATSYDQLNGLSMLGIMAACLLFQGALDLLD